MAEIQHYDYPNVKSVVVCGDIHGKFETLVYQCCVKYKMRDTLIIVAGDCGFVYRAPAYYIDLWFGRLGDRLLHANNYIAFVRGNHDNPFYFDGKIIGAPNFRAVPDYSVLTACGHQILCVGGAISIDRAERTEGKDYWADEKPVYSAKALAELRRVGYRIDTVVTHTAPSFCEFVTPPPSVTDPALLADMHDERETMDLLLDALRYDGHPLRRWYYGHFHHSWNACIDGIDYTMLAEMEMKELR